jgi:hypothetical protein
MPQGKAFVSVCANQGWAKELRIIFWPGLGVQPISIRIDKTMVITQILTGHTAGSNAENIVMTLTGSVLRVNHGRMAFYAASAFM